MDISYIDTSIEKLTNLEILDLGFNDVAVEIPFESISKLNTLKALTIWDWSFATNIQIPNDICNLKKIVYFSLTYMPEITSFPFDCIGEQWSDLTYLRIHLFAHITNVDLKLLKMSNLNTLYIESADLDPMYFDLDSFDGYSSSLKRISLSGNERLCNGSIWISNTEYYGFGHLTSSNGNNNFTNDDLNEYTLLQFIQTFDPCYHPCETLSFVSIEIHFAYMLARVCVYMCFVDIVVN